MNLDKCTGMEQSHQHQPDRKDTTPPQRFISFIGFYISLIAFILCGSLSSSHSFLFSQMTPAKKMVPTPGSSRIVSRVVSSRFLSRIQNKSPLQRFYHTNTDIIFVRVILQLCQCPQLRQQHQSMGTVTQTWRFSHIRPETINKT